MATINERVRTLFEDLSTDPLEERVIEYVVREVHSGRSLTETLDDPYVRNRLNDEKRAELVENPEIIDALEQEIRTSFKAPEAGF